MKYLKWIPVVILLIACAALPAFAAESSGCAEAWLEALDSGSGALEEVSLVPEDFTGFCIGYPDGRTPDSLKEVPSVRSDEYMLKYYALDPAVAEALFSSASPVSVGPGGAVLWRGPLASSSGLASFGSFFVQRDHDVIPLAYTPDRGAGDSGHTLYDALFDLLNNPAVVLPPPEWSSDGRYLRIRIAQDDHLCLLDTATGEIFAAVSSAPEASQGFPEDGASVYEQSSDLLSRYASVQQWVPVADSACLLAWVTEFIPRAESWSVIGSDEPRLLLVDSDTRAILPLRCDDDVLSLPLACSAVYGDTFMMEGKAVRLNPSPAAAPDPVSGTTADPAVLDTLALEYNQSYGSGEYSYRVSALAADQLTLINCDFASQGFLVADTVRVQPEGFHVVMDIDLNPDFCLIPYGITVDRWTVFTSAMSKATKKSVSSCYTKVTPENVQQKENADELLTLYPALADETMYILKSNVSQDRKKDLEACFAEVAYSRDDYLLDAPAASLPASDEAVRHEIRYQFVSEAGSVRWTAGPALAMATLLDHLGSTAVYGWAQADPRPESIGECFPEECAYEGVDYRVSLEDVQEEGSCLTLVFTVVPSGSRGAFPED